MRGRGEAGREAKDMKEGRQEERKRGRQEGRREGN